MYRPPGGWRRSPSSFMDTARYDRKTPRIKQREKPCDYLTPRTGTWMDGRLRIPHILPASRLQNRVPWFLRGRLNYADLFFLQHTRWQRLYVNWPLLVLRQITASFLRQSLRIVNSETIQAIFANHKVFTVSKYFLCSYQFDMFSCPPVEPVEWIYYWILHQCFLEIAGRNLLAPQGV